MENNSSSNSMENRQIFVNLFYAVILGAACSRIDLSASVPVCLCQLLLIFVILEDWYGFYKVVSVEIAEKPYSVRSLLFEASILLSWFYAFIALPQHLTLYACLFSLFYVLKLCAGFSAYKGQKILIHNDLIFLIPACTFLVRLLFNPSLTVILLVQLTSVILCTILWWCIRGKR